MAWRGFVLSEERVGRQQHTKTATHKQQTSQHARGCAACCVCHGVVCGRVGCE